MYHFLSLISLKGKLFQGALMTGKTHDNKKGVGRNATIQ